MQVIIAETLEGCKLAKTPELTLSWDIQVISPCRQTKPLISAFPFEIMSYCDLISCDHISQWPYFQWPKFLWPTFLCPNFLHPSNIND
jgi:hypothetical protein